MNESRIRGGGDGGYLGELFKRPGVVFTGVVAWEVGRCDVGYCLGVYANELVLGKLNGPEKAGSEAY